MASMKTFSRLSSAFVQPSDLSRLVSCWRTDWRNLNTWVGFTKVMLSSIALADVFIDVSSGLTSGVISFFDSASCRCCVFGFSGVIDEKVAFVAFAVANAREDSIPPR